IGVDRWIEQQLNPGKLDDSAMQARLQPYRTLAMDPKELLQNFPPPFVLKAVADGRVPMPKDPEQRAVYESQMAMYKARNAGKAAQGNDADANGMDDATRAQRREARMYAELKAEQIMSLPPEQRAAEIMKLSPEERALLARGMSQEDRQRVLEGMSPEQRETLLAMANPRAVVAGEMQSAKILRAAYSERQLEEVMTDFWFNHFNVYDKKGPDAYLIGEYEREVIRPRALGKFEGLLLATAKSPAMLFYLDNWQSVGPNSDFAKNGFQQQRRGGGRFGRRQQPRMDNDPRDRQLQQARQRRSGLNENYAREVMELHTLGVDGGYTQQDVTELAKVLTGWTVRQPRLGGGFQYNDRFHEPGTKTVLGKRFSGGGEAVGEAALKMLARHPSTAKFISRKLAMRFVSDEPPAALVDRMAQTFLRSDGDIKEVLRTLFHSPEFWARESYRAKVKTPFEFVVSSIRATGAELENPFVIAQALNKMGMPLYGMQPPTGYSMKADAWVNSAALLNRMNFALGLGTGRLPGVRMDGARVLGDPGARTAEQTLTALEAKLLAGDVSPQTHVTLAKQLSDPKITGASMTGANPGANPGIIAGLILGSPEFQRR
ncbi:MAG TPA: DUF1800 domain-containing protein, partial [Terriglobales bacterium]|nr:DUF1800 domain-containing protein [Terriglobales bacterium]